MESKFATKVDEMRDSPQNSDTWAHELKVCYFSSWLPTGVLGLGLLFPKRFPTRVIHDSVPESESQLRKTVSLSPFLLLKPYLPDAGACSYFFPAFSIHSVAAWFVEIWFYLSLKMLLDRTDQKPSWVWIGVCLSFGDSVFYWTLLYITWRCLLPLAFTHSHTVCPESRATVKM